METLIHQNQVQVPQEILVPTTQNPEKKEKKKLSEYFTKETSDWISNYLSEPNYHKKNHIFVTHIQPPIIEIIKHSINQYGGVDYMDGDLDDIIQEILSFVVLKVLPKHKPEIKNNFFSYICVSVKNYIIMHNKSAYRRLNRSEPLDSFDEEKESLNGFIYDNSHGYIKKSYFLFDAIIEYFENNADKIFNANEIPVALVLLKNMKDLASNDFSSINKKVIFVNIKKELNCKTYIITRVISRMKEHILIIKKEMNQLDIN